MASITSAAIYATYAAYTILLLWGIINDLWALRIPNGISVGIVLLFLILGALVHLHLPWLSHLGSFALVFALSLVLFYFDVMGGGDVKFLAAASLWVGMDQLSLFLLAVALFGGVLSIILLAIRLYTRRHPAARLPSCLKPGQPVPYGVAIGAGALLVFYGPQISRLFLPA